MYLTSWIEFPITYEANESIIACQQWLGFELARRKGFVPASVDRHTSHRRWHTQTVSDTRQGISDTSQPVSDTRQPVSDTHQPVSGTRQPVSDTR